MTGDVEPSLTPDLRDPRVMVAVPRERRAAKAALWELAARLTRLLRDAREPLIGQIKLAWWRDMTGLLATDPAALPKGEPLLAELQQSWAGQGGLDTLVDAAEAMLLAESGEAREEAATAFGAALFGLSGGADAAGKRWGLLWAAASQESEADARTLFAAARAAPPPPRATFHGMRALLMLDRWAGTIAARGGERRWRREGLLLLRIGLFGR
jgi:phytoene synthase